LKFKEENKEFTDETQDLSGKIVSRDRILINIKFPGKVENKEKIYGVLGGEQVLSNVRIFLSKI